MKKLFLFILTPVFFCSCKKDFLSTPAFDVTVEKQSYKVGENVVFSLAGNPDYITFFSGEPGLKYEYNNRFTSKGIPKLQFTSARANGTQPGSLQLMVSANFAGVGADSTATAANIASASWTDITSRAVLSTGAAVASGAIDLSDFVSDKPVYIAFKYNAQSGSIQNKWTISGLTVTNTLPDQSVYTIANLTAAAITNYGVATVISPGWVGYKISNNYNWVISAGTSLVITGATTAVTATAPAEAWTFAGGVLLNKVANDIGVAIKETSSRLATPNYTYPYKAAGNYTVTFVASNSNIEGQREVVKQIQLTITP
jgi:hypothetical protein